MLMADLLEETTAEVVRLAVENTQLREALKAADKIASEAHDAIYAEPFDQKGASDAIWRLHNILRDPKSLSGGADTETTR